MFYVLIFLYSTVHVDSVTPGAECINNECAPKNVYDFSHNWYL